MATANSGSNEVARRQAVSELTTSGRRVSGNLEKIGEKIAEDKSIGRWIRTNTVEPFSFSRRKKQHVLINLPRDEILIHNSRQ